MCCVSVFCNCLCVYWNTSPVRCGKWIVTAQSKVG
jgi:hypothetical protein